MVINIMPINPTTDQILDKKCYSSVGEVDQPIDIVDVFRPSDQVLPVSSRGYKEKAKSNLVTGRNS